jgi:hypothetical protein
MYTSLAQAARATGLDKSTILRAIRSHKISAAKSERDGGWMIDPAELHRVFPPAPAGNPAGLSNNGGNAEGVAGPRDATAVATVATAVLEAQVAALRETVDLLRRQLDGQAALVEDVRTDRDHWRAQAEALPRLLAPPERRPWWRRLAG